ncbi:putative nuclear RNA export factor SDE5 [Carica papaya]|uniref:putative nuclear RNA export factor SDE5 n=1 Tax=Carica papaya TaxID=3649 RepID=UPI000B8CADCF|nr:putative nuclear RNA export factor SDE5 [Carica papaya]
MMLDLHEVGAKDAIRLLKCHLSSLAGIPCIKYLKVVLEGNDEDISKGARRRLVMKLLERESITWSEDENIGTISIRLDIVDPKSLSFAKK